MCDPSLRSRFAHYLGSPTIASLLAAGGLFAVCLGLLHPRYAINDDLKIISILAGYPAGNPAPFPVFSNVLLGFVLVPLYRLHTPANWEILLFLALDLASTWALLYILLSRSTSALWRLLGTCTILIPAAYFALNITFTNAAGFACFSGFCLILASARPDAPIRRGPGAAGILLVLLGSLIRPEMLVLALPTILVAVVCLFRSLQSRVLIVAGGITAILVLAALGFDRLYVRLHPDWNTYYFYNKAAQQVLDAHRLSNVGTRIKHISWSTNDQEVFARAFFPDAGIFSIDRLQYLIAHVPASGQAPIASARAIYRRLIAPSVLPTSLLIVVLCVLPLTLPVSLPRRLGTIAIALGFFFESVFLAWAYKNPDWVFFGALSTTPMLQLLVLNWNGLPGNRPGTDPTWRRVPRLGILAVILVLLGMSIGQSILSSQQNLQKQRAYHQILSDLARLQAGGQLAPDAIIIAPSHGIPWEWGNPLRLEMPPISFLDTGWTTFSPFYEQALEHYDLQPLPEALYERDNVYVMTKQVFKAYLARYYEEHLHITVELQPIYTLPSQYSAVEYEDTQLYKVVRVK